PEAARYVLVHVRDDLGASGRELLDHTARDALEVGESFVRRLPLDAERAGEFGAQVGLIEVAGGEPVGLEDWLAVERPPLPVARAAGHVADDHVRMEMRVLRARGAMLVGGGDEPLPLLATNAAGPAANDAGFVLEVRERRLPRDGVRLVDGPAGVRVAERV